MIKKIAIISAIAVTSVVAVKVISTKIKNEKGDTIKPEENKEKEIDDKELIDSNEDDGLDNMTFGESHEKFINDDIQADVKLISKKSDIDDEDEDEELEEITAENVNDVAIAYRVLLYLYCINRDNADIKIDIRDGKKYINGKLITKVGNYSALNYIFIKSGNTLYGWDTSSIPDEYLDRSIEDVIAEYRNKTSITTQFEVYTMFNDNGKTWMDKIIDSTPSDDELDVLDIVDIYDIDDYTEDKVIYMDINDIIKIINGSDEIEEFVI